MAGAGSTPAVIGAGFLPGEVLVGGRPGYSFDFGPGYIQAYSSMGTYQRDTATLPFGHPRDAIMLGNDILDADDGAILRIHPDATMTVYAGGDPDGRPYTALTMDAGGNLFVATFSFTVRKLDTTGRTLAQYSLPSDSGTFGVFSMDLAPDQCTLFYAAARQRIKNYDICRSSGLSDFVDIGPGISVRMIRVLTDGTVLAAASNGIIRFSRSGEVIKIYGEHAGIPWVSLSVLADGTSFWAGGALDAGGSQITKFDLTSGAVLAGPVPTPVPSVPSFSVPPEFVLVVGEHRAAQPFFPTAPPRRRAVRNH